MVLRQRLNEGVGAVFRRLRGTRWRKMSTIEEQRQKKRWQLAISAEMKERTTALFWKKGLIWNSADEGCLKMRLIIGKHTKRVCLDYALRNGPNFEEVRKSKPILLKQWKYRRDLPGRPQVVVTGPSYFDQTSEEIEDILSGYRSRRRLWSGARLL